LVENSAARRHSERVTTLFKFANYAFDVHAGLEHDGIAVHLPPKEKGLLNVLLEARGQIVRKEDVMVKVWGTGETSDESISRTVYRLRMAMQASGGAEVIGTVYNSGFRISVPIRETLLRESSSLSALTQSQLPSAIAALNSAREYLARQSVQDIEIAAQAARLAISHDPTFAAAWTTLAEIRLVQAIRSLRPPREAGWLAQEAARTALSIDPHSAAALAIVGWVHTLMDREGARGLAELDRALALDPDYWLTTMLRAWALQAVGRSTEAVAMMRRTEELNALGPAIQGGLALYLMLDGQATPALDAALNLAQRLPTVDHVQGVASVLCSVHGMHDESIGFGLRAAALAPDTPLMRAPLACALARAGRAEDAHAELARMQASPLPFPGASVVPAYLALGERDKALALLREAAECGAPQFAWTRNDPRLAALRGYTPAEAVWAGGTTPLLAA